MWFGMRNGYLDSRCASWWRKNELGNHKNLCIKNISIYSSFWSWSQRNKSFAAFGHLFSVWVFCVRDFHFLNTIYLLRDGPCSAFVSTEKTASPIRRCIEWPILHIFVAIVEQFRGTTLSQSKYGIVTEFWNEWKDNRRIRIQLA